MLYNANEIDAYDRQLIFVLNNAVNISPHLDQTQKETIERLLQEIVDTWTRRN
jgi:hypothetical protein